MTSPKVKSSAANSAKRLARLAAIQALYQSSYEQQPIPQIIRDCIDMNFNDFHEDIDGGEVLDGKPDAELFGKIANGVANNLVELDEIIAGALNAKLSAGRLEILLRSILRAGVYELLHHDDIPSSVIINDYIDVAKAFFNGKEPGLVNGILDKLAEKLRSS